MLTRQLFVNVYAVMTIVQHTLIAYYLQNLVFSSILHTYIWRKTVRCHSNK